MASVDRHSTMPASSSSSAQPRRSPSPSRSKDRHRDDSSRHDHHRSRSPARHSTHRERDRDYRDRRSDRPHEPERERERDRSRSGVYDADRYERRERARDREDYDSYSRRRHHDDLDRHGSRHRHSSSSRSDRPQQRDHSRESYGHRDARSGAHSSAHSSAHSIAHSRRERTPPSRAQSARRPHEAEERSSTQSDAAVKSSDVKSDAKTSPSVTKRSLVGDDDEDIDGDDNDRSNLVVTDTTNKKPRLAPASKIVFKPLQKINISNELPPSEPLVPARAENGSPVKKIQKGFAVIAKRTVGGESRDEVERMSETLSPKEREATPEVVADSPKPGSQAASPEVVPANMQSDSEITQNENEKAEEKEAERKQTRSPEPPEAPTEPQQAPAQEPLISDPADIAEDDEDDDDDMFAEAGDNQNIGKSTKRSIPVLVHAGKEGEATLQSNWDDDEGYYRIIIGEIFEGRYHIQSNLGKGMFSSVVKAFDKVENRSVAIKIIRNNDIMFKAGQKESGILTKVNQSDPDDKMHIIRLIRKFQYRGHLCLVFEGMSSDMRELVKKVGRESSVNIGQIQSYAKQIFLGLEHLRSNNILHADIKPDNILVSADRKTVKIADLGSASDASENEITPYLASRFYRAPELIVGLQYDFAIDTWSAGCTLFELYTGKILFAGNNNNNMLKVIMETRGKLSHKMLRKGLFTSTHFDEHLNFLSREIDRLTGKPTVKVMPFAGSKPVHDIRARVLEVKNTSGSTAESQRLVALFVDFLDKCLNLTPEKRMTPAEALKHPFLSSA
ncbi:serine/threonine-protein kinase prp4 [Myxozyma melibiosi]|uniref:non-specific serine/threonine protein kinase n=1 Tax=Myxozyma melibiosi TaxID=54550 RepID=A0ABR1F6D2_9ASCO